MSTPQRVAPALQVIDGGHRWPSRPLGGAAFRMARRWLLLAAFAYGPSHPVGHIAREMAHAMRGL